MARGQLNNQLAGVQDSEATSRIKPMVPVRSMKSRLRVKLSGLLRYSNADHNDGINASA